jgi:hypothetical protein
MLNVYGCANMEKAGCRSGDVWTETTPSCQRVVYIKYLAETDIAGVQARPLPIERHRSNLFLSEEGIPEVIDAVL